MLSIATTINSLGYENLNYLHTSSVRGENMEYSMRSGPDAPATKDSAHQTQKITTKTRSPEELVT